MRLLLGLTRFLHFPLDPGLSIKICGSCDELGCWNPEDGVTMDLASGVSHFQKLQSTFWSAEVEINMRPGECVLFKFVCMWDNDIVEWEGLGPDHNRQSIIDSLDHGTQMQVLPVCKWKETAGCMSEFEHTTLFYSNICASSSIHYDYIGDNIYLGSCPRNKLHLQQLANEGVTVIFNLQTPQDILTNCLNFDIDAISGEDIGDCITKYCASLSIGYVWMPAQDMSTLGRIRVIPHAVHVLKGLLSSGHTVYVHCNAGVGRSTAVVAAYYHFVKDHPLDVVNHFLSSKRPVIYFDSQALIGSKDDYYKKFVVKRF